MFQRWENLLFLHWTVCPESIQKTLPDGLFVDTFNGNAFLGIVPFFMKGIRPKLFPPCPGLSSFPELNLRTYVYDRNGRPGVWFYSLDADHWLAVKIARTFFHLPYEHASISSEFARNGTIQFFSRRKSLLYQIFKYKHGAKVPASKPDSVEFFLTERYHLFSFDKKSSQLYIGQVYHAPYSLTEPAVLAYDTSLFTLNGFNAPADDPIHAISSHRVDVEIYPLRKV